MGGLKTARAAEAERLPAHHVDLGAEGEAADLAYANVTGPQLPHLSAARNKGSRVKEIREPLSYHTQCYFIINAIDKEMIEWELKRGQQQKRDSSGPEVSSTEIILRRPKNRFS